MKLDIMNKVSMMTGRTGLKIQSVSPEILIGVGITSIIGGTIMACKATLKADAVLDEIKKDVDKVHEVREKADKDKYSTRDYQKDMGLVYLRAAGRMLKLYWPALMLGGIGVTSILSGYDILHKRNVAVMAAYNAIEKGFSDYRSRVVKEMGEEADRRFRYGLEKKDMEVVEEDENGKEKKTKVKDAECIDGNELPAYAKIFDAASSYWRKSPEQNYYFLRLQQNYANDILNSRGHLFLNEVYDMLDIPRTTEGQAVGWLKKDGNNNFVDFGLHNIGDEGVRRFVNGYEANVYLDFNVDGVIMHEFDKVCRK